MTSLPDRENIWSFYTGKKNKTSTRTYKSVLGYNESMNLAQNSKRDFWTSFNLASLSNHASNRIQL